MRERLQPMAPARRGPTPRAPDPLDVAQGACGSRLLQWPFSPSATHCRLSVPSVQAVARARRSARRLAFDGPWRFGRLLDAPYRLAFFTAATMVSASALWWLAVLAARFVPGSGLAWSVAPGHAHALLMGFSFMPMFFAGFLMTAGPRWLAVPAVAARTLLPTVAAWLAGWATFVAGTHFDARMAAFGLAVVAAGWSAFAWRFARMLASSKVRDRTHLRVIGAASGAGAAALWTAAAGLASHQPAVVQVAISTGLWWFLAPVFATAMHRMVPVFGVLAPRLDERHPNWLLWTLLAVLAMQVPLTAWPAGAVALAPATLVLDTAAATLVLWLAVRWATLQNLRIRLLAMLHIGFAWLGISLALLAASAAMAWSSGGVTDLRLAGLHALGIGFFGSAQLAFVTRISAGQTARSQAADDIAWALFRALQAAVALRIAAAWRPDAAALVLAAALLWAGVMLAWSARYVRWYGRPRVDGRPG